MLNNCGVDRLFQLRGERLNLVRNFFVSLILVVFFQVICSCIVEHVKHDEVIIRGSDSPKDFQEVQGWRIVAPYSRSHLRIMNPKHMKLYESTPPQMFPNTDAREKQYYDIPDESKFIMFVTQLTESLRNRDGIRIIKSGSDIGFLQEPKIGIIRISVPQLYEFITYDSYDPLSGHTTLGVTRRYANLKAMLYLESPYGERSINVEVSFSEFEYKSELHEVVHFFALDIADAINSRK